MDYIYYTLTDPELNIYKQCSVQIQVGLVVNAIQTVVSLLFVKVEDSDFTQKFFTTPVRVFISLAFKEINSNNYNNSTITVTYDLIRREVDCGCSFRVYSLKTVQVHCSCSAKISTSSAARLSLA